MKGKTVDHEVRLLLTKKSCIRKNFCRLLDSTFDEDSQKDEACCSYCDYDPVDPNKLFVYSKRRLPLATARKPKRGKSSILTGGKTKTADWEKIHLEKRLVDWRRNEVKARGLSFIGEGVASNQMLSKLVDISHEIVNVTDVEALGVQARFAPSLFQAIRETPTKSIEGAGALHDTTNTAPIF